MDRFPAAPAEIRATPFPPTQPNDAADLELTAHVEFEFTKGDGRPDPWGTPDDAHVTGVKLFGIPVELPEAVLRKIEAELLS